MTRGIIDQIEQDLETRLQEAWELEVKVEDLQFKLTALKLDIAKLSEALEVLNGKKQLPSEPLVSGVRDNSQVPEPEKDELRVQETVLQDIPRNVRPPGSVICNSCDGYMFMNQRTLQSGRTVNLWVCNECSNERL